MNNSKKNDDIDLFVITAKRRLWTTRLLALAVLLLLGEKRKRNDFFGIDKICLNMLLSEDSLTIPKKDRNLFSAHEVVQVKPLFDKNNIYEKFLFANKWVTSFLPNTVLSQFKFAEKSKSKISIVDKFFDKIEFFLFIFQYLYMRRNITSEVVGTSVAKFHPKDMKKYVLELYELRYSSIFEANFDKKPRHYSRLLT